jgi:hypothetical protein
VLCLALLIGPCQLSRLLLETEPRVCQLRLTRRQVVPMLRLRRLRGLPSGLLPSGLPAGLLQLQLLQPVLVFLRSEVGFRVYGLGFRV